MGEISLSSHPWLAGLHVALAASRPETAGPEERARGYEERSPRRIVLPL